MRTTIYALMAFGSIVTAMPTMAPYDCPNSLICKDNGKCAGTEIACTPPPPEPEIKQVRPDAVRPTAPYKCSDKTICRENGKCGNGDACTPPIPDLVIEQAKPGPMRDPATCPSEKPSCSAAECGSAFVAVGKEVEGETGMCGFYTASDLEGCPCTVHTTFLSHEPRPKGT